jgi:DNA-binding IclR family transcriptional regulator
MTTGIPIKSVERTMNIVDLLAEEGEMTLGEIADTLGHPKSTLHDHLKTLQDLDLLVNERNGYKLSGKFLEIGSKWRSTKDIYQISKEEVDELANNIEEHASLMIEEGGMGCVLYTAKGPKSIKLSIHPGIQSPLNTTASGKAILAYLPEKRIHEIVGNRGLPKLTENTITDLETLKTELSEIRSRRYGTNHDEQVEGISGYAVPILSQDQRVYGAVSVYGPSYRINTPEKEAEFIDLLQQSANVLEMDLAYH